MELTDREIAIITEALLFFSLNQSFADIKEIQEVDQIYDKFKNEETIRKMI